MPRANDHGQCAPDQLPNTWHARGCDGGGVRGLRRDHVLRDRTTREHSQVAAAKGPSTAPSGGTTMADAVRPRTSKAILVNGAVKPWHVIFLYSVCYAVGDVGSYYLTKSDDPAIRYELRNLMVHAIGSTILLAFTIVVPEFRRSLPILFSSGIARMTVREFVLAVALFLCWGYGVYRIAICLPILLARPEAYDVLHFSESIAPWQTKYVLMYVGMVSAAPIGEELLFRGYLMNLWCS